MSKNDNTQKLDSTLRPKSWDTYVGQEEIKKNISILITAALERGDMPEHILLYGPAGLGKTTLAHLIAKSCKGNLKITSGPAIERAGDFAALVTNLAPNDVLFIDEIHRLNKNIEEILYPAMESGGLDIIVGKGASARVVRIDLPPFTLIAATTQVSLISAPLRSRFSGGVFRLDYYRENEIEKIITQSARILKLTHDKQVAQSIACRSRGIPRVANYLLRRCRDFAQINNTDLNVNTVNETMKMLHIDELGLTPFDITLLSTIYKKYNNKPVGLSTLSVALGEDATTIEGVIEPFLIQIGLLQRTPQGRVVTDKCISYLQSKK